MIEYGVVIGRFQPVHMGHQAIVNEILLDGRIPIIVIGSCNADRDLDKNPLDFEQRVELWQTLYPDTEMYFVESLDTTHELWYNNIYNQVWQIAGTKDNVMIYYHNKEEDRYSFVYRGAPFNNTFYTDIFKVENWWLKQIEFAKRSDIKIEANARDIRHNLEAFKHLLDGRVYFKLKEMNMGEKKQEEDELTYGEVKEKDNKVNLEDIIKSHGIDELWDEALTAIGERFTKSSADVKDAYTKFLSDDKVKKQIDKIRKTVMPESFNKTYGGTPKPDEKTTDVVKRSPTVVLVSGRKRAGKDYVSALIQGDILRNRKGTTALTYSLATPLKDIVAKTLSTTVSGVDSAKNAQLFLKEEKTGFTVGFREILQNFGTEAMKPWFGANVWTDLFLKQDLQTDYIIISDWRFKAEHQRIKDTYANVVTVRVFDDNSVSTDTHASETELDDFAFDYVIDNTSKDTTVIPKVQSLVKEI